MLQRPGLHRHCRGAVPGGIGAFFYPPAKGIAAPGAGDASLTEKLDQSYPYVLVRRTVAILGGSGDVQIGAAMLAGTLQLCLDRLACSR